MSASVIRYRKLVTTDVARQAVNLAESGTMGHRVQIQIPVDDLNAIFTWDRPAGSDRPVGHFNAQGITNTFDTILSKSFSKVYTDVDGITNGLNFSSAILDANNDSRVRKGGEVMANDIVMCYIIYKCYGSSSAPTEGVIYNLQDAHDMLSNGALVSAIHTSLSAEEALTNNPGVDKGAIDAMFRDLLAADPSRFFDAAGKQIPGLFETAFDTDAKGSWGFVENDKIEIAVQMRFMNSVTRRSVESGSEESETIVIPAGASFKIRLQLLAVDTPAGAIAKQELSSDMISAEIASQAIMTAKAAANAATAQRAAAQALSTAAAQTASAQARYQKAVEDNAKQAKAVATAQANMKAAQAALDQAIISGKKDSDIQNQRAAALNATALAENLQAIAELAATDLQNAKLAADTAAATLANAQLQAATAAANVTAANAAAALAAKVKAEDDALTLASEKAAADAASDPLTKKIDDAERVIIDPQTLVTLDAKFGAATKTRMELQEEELDSARQKYLATEKYTMMKYNVDYAISLGKNNSEIQVLVAALKSALAEKTAAELKATASLSTLTSSYNTELKALSESIQAKKDSALLIRTIAAADVNEATRKLTTATASYTYASTVTSDALEAVNMAQTTLDARISGGAIFNEVQTRRKAVLDANTFLSESKVKSDKANAAMIDAQKLVDASNIGKNSAESNLSTVISKEDSRLSFFQSTMSSANQYQLQKENDAKQNKLDQDVTESLIRLNIANDKASSATMIYTLAKRDLDAALAGGKRLSEITVLQRICQEAQIEKQRSDLELQISQANYNKYVPAVGDVATILISAAQFQSTQNSLAAANSMALSLNSTLAMYLDSKSELLRKKEIDDLLLKNLASIISSGSSLTEITVLKQKKIDSSNEYAKAIADFNYASKAMSTMNQGITENPNVSTILYTANMLRESEISLAKENALIKSVNTIYSEFILSSENTKYLYENLQVLKDMLQKELSNGKGIEDITELQSQIQNSYIKYAESERKTTMLNNELNALRVFNQPDTSLEQTLSTSLTGVYTSILEEMALKSISSLTMAEITKNTSEANYVAAQAEYDLITEEMNTAIRQGKTTAQLSGLISSLNGKGTELANKMSILNIASKSLSTAKGSWNNQTTLLNTSSFVNLQNDEYSQISSTLKNTTDTIKNSISSAKANVLTRQLTQTYMDMIHLSTLVTENTYLYESVSKSFDTAIAQGQTLIQIQELRDKLQEYSRKKALTQTDLINKTNAYMSSLAIATQSQDAKGILDVIAHQQNNVLNGFKANELLKNLISAKNVAFDLNIQDTAARSELLIATSDLDITTANGINDKEKYDAILEKSNTAAIIRNKLVAANAAVALAESYVNMNLNVQAIQDSATITYEAQNSKLQAQILAEQYYKAKAYEEEMYTALSNAKDMLDIASQRFEKAITFGTDISEIQNARDNLNKAASELNTASSLQSYAKAALNTALANANLSQTALALITTARVNDANVVAGANTTTEQYKLDLLNEQLDKAKEKSENSSAQNLAAYKALNVASLVEIPMNITETDYTSEPTNSVFLDGRKSLQLSEITRFNLLPEKTYFTFRAGQVNKDISVDFRTTSDLQNYYSFILTASGTYSIQKDTSIIYTGLYTKNTEFSLLYDNSRIYYYVNRFELFSEVATGQLKLVFVTTTSNTTITNVYKAKEPLVVVPTTLDTLTFKASNPPQSTDLSGSSPPFTVNANSIIFNRAGSAYTVKKYGDSTEENVFSMRFRPGQVNKNFSVKLKDKDNLENNVFDFVFADDGSITILFYITNDFTKPTPTELIYTSTSEVIISYQGSTGVYGVCVDGNATGTGTSLVNAPGAHFEITGDVGISVNNVLIRHGYIQPLEIDNTIDSNIFMSNTSGGTPSSPPSNIVLSNNSITFNTAGVTITEKTYTKLFAVYTLGLQMNNVIRIQLGNSTTKQAFFNSVATYPSFLTGNSYSGDSLTTMYLGDTWLLEEWITITSTSVFKITYDGKTIRYYIDEVEIYSFLVPTEDEPLRMAFGIDTLVETYTVNNIMLRIPTDNTEPSYQISQEIYDLKNAALSAANTSYTDIYSMRILTSKVLEQKAIVNKYKMIQQQTLAAVSENNLINFLLFNGFIFQQSINRYVLKKDMVPATVGEGINIVLYSLTITPIHLEVYSNTTAYVLGNLVYYPDDTSPQYMCLVGSDPRSSSISNIIGRDPISNTICWIKTQDGNYRYKASTDLQIREILSSTPYSVTIALTGTFADLQILFINSDINGNNTLMDGLIAFGTGIPESTIISPTTITSIQYITSDRSTLKINFSTLVNFIPGESIINLRNAKTVLSAAKLAYQTYITNLVNGGFVPLTTLGNLTKSLINTTLLPSILLVGTPFTIGTSTITPVQKGLYSSTVSYITGDVVSDSYGTLHMCLIGPDSRGSSYSTVVGNAPVERPFTSIYWHIIDNKGWDSFTYTPTTDLQLTPVEIVNNTLLWTSSEYPPNINIQLDSSFLSGYLMIGSGINMRTLITSFSYTYSSNSIYSYRFLFNANINTNIGDTFYVRNGRSFLESATTTSVCNTLSANVISAITYAKSIISLTNNESAETVKVNISSIRISVVNLQTFYSANTTLTTYINTALSIIDECVKAGGYAAIALLYYLKAVEGGVTTEITDLQSGKTEVTTHLNTLNTLVNTAANHISSQNNTGAAALIPNMQTTNSSMDFSANQYAYYYNMPGEVGYTLLDNKNTPGGNYGRSMGTGIRAYIETPTQMNLWNIGRSDYTLEFVVIAGDNVNTSGDFVDNFAQLTANTILMGLNSTSNTGPAFALANWGAWRGLIGFNGNNNTWGPLFANSTANSITGTYMTNASNFYNFGKYAQNHYCEVRKNNSQTVYLNGHKVLEYNTIYSAPSNAIVLSPGDNNATIFNGPTPPFWQIGSSNMIWPHGNAGWTGGIRNIRLSKEAVYISSFNTSSTIKGPDSVYFKNLECLSTSILLLPLNDSRYMRDYGISRLRVSTMAFSQNINSTIRHLSSFAIPPPFTSLGISPVCHLPLSTNTLNIGTNGIATTITGTVNTFSTMKGKSGVIFREIFSDSISASFNATSNLTMSCWYYCSKNTFGLGIYGGEQTGSLISFYNRWGSTEGSGVGAGWWTIDVSAGGSMALGSNLNTGIGNICEKPDNWNYLGYVVSTTTTGVSMYGYLNGICVASNDTTYNSSSPIYNSLQSMNRITIGRNERADGTHVGPWKGAFKDVTVFDRPFTASEMMSLYTEKLYSEK